MWDPDTNIGSRGAKGRTFGARGTPAARLEGNEEKLAASVRKGIKAKWRWRADCDEK